MTTTVEQKGIEVGPADEAALDSWDDLVERSPQGTVFHRRGFLEAVASVEGIDLTYLIGRKGRETVGIFPVFERTMGPISVVFSPPPDLGLFHLGPATFTSPGMNQRTREKRLHRFVRAAIDWVEAEMDPKFFHVRTHFRLSDARPFVWNGFDATPRYKYVVDVSDGEDAVWDRMSSSARRSIDKASERCEIREGDLSDGERILEHLADRHEEQGISYPVTHRFVSALDRRLDDEHVDYYVCTVDGEYATGTIIVRDEETVYNWQGSARPLGDVDVPVNDLLNWHVAKDAIDTGRSQCDLVGANTQSICQFKSKFGPTLYSYESLKKSSRIMDSIASVYQQIS